MKSEDSPLSDEMYKAIISIEMLDLFHARFPNGWEKTASQIFEIKTYNDKEESEQDYINRIAYRLRFQIGGLRTAYCGGSGCSFFSLGSTS